jgi:hypothetical protein
MDKIYFTVEQIDQLRAALMEMPYRHAYGFLKFIDAIIAQQQINQVEETE